MTGNTPEMKTDLEAGGSTNGAGDSNASTNQAVWAALIVTVAIAAGAGGFALGSNSGEDLDAAAAQGTRQGSAAGAAAGKAKGRRVGLRAGKKAAYKPAYDKAYKRAYDKAVNGE